MSTNLPLLLTSFIGRDRELAEIRERLDGCRLLTLTGTGGVGKSRLAVELSAQLLEDYPDGVWWVELGALTEAAAVARAVAAAIGLREQPGKSLLDDLKRYFNQQRVFIVLDNCEHLLAACANLAEGLLRSCPELRLLVTSREALNVEGERIWLTPSLSLVAATGPSEAAELFANRASEANPGFLRAYASHPRVSTICRHLDGIPLAIELAAARTNVLSLEQIAARLDERFELLTGGRRTALPRHRTLRALVDWSYELLSDPERVLFRRLSIFAGGWRLEAAEAISSGDGIEPTDVLQMLGRLVARSLVHAEDRGNGMRYGMLETLRQYAAEKLQQSGEEEWLRRRHLGWFVEQAEAVESERLWSADLEPERENIAAALRWAVENATSLVDGMRLCSAVLWSWSISGHLPEGLEVAARFVSAGRALQARDRGELPSETWAKLLASTGFGAASMGQLSEGEALLEECLRLTTDVPANAVRLRALLSRALLDLFKRNLDGAARYVEESGRLIAASRDIPARYMYNYEQFELARLGGDFVTAEQHLRKNLVIAQAQHDLWSNQMAAAWLGNLALDRGDHAQARAYLEEALGTGAELGDAYSVVFGLEGLAAVQVAEGQWARALQLVGAAAEQRMLTGLTAAPVHVADLERRIAPAREALGPVASEAAWRAGRAMSRAQAIAYALSTTEASDAARPVAQPQLTVREQQVAALVGRGLTNRQIAETLVISVGTAALHVQHVFSKLGLHSRSQLAVWAIEHGNAPREGRSSNSKARSTPQRISK